MAKSVAMATNEIQAVVSFIAQPTRRATAAATGTGTRGTEF